MRVGTVDRPVQGRETLARRDLLADGASAGAIGAAAAAGFRFGRRAIILGNPEEAGRAGAEAAAFTPIVALIQKPGIRSASILSVLSPLSANFLQKPR